MSAPKKPWTKPQLIVLGRGTPEENVLAGCKHGGNSGPGSNNCKFHGMDCSNQSKS